MATYAEGNNHQPDADVSVAAKENMKRGEHVSGAKLRGKTPVRKMSRY
jgi:hypothetical protein